MNLDWLCNHILRRHVPVYVLRSFGKCTELLSNGSGFLIASICPERLGNDTLAFTAYHVIRPDEYPEHFAHAPSIDLDKDYIQLGSAPSLEDRSSFCEAKVLWFDHSLDVAILRIVNPPVCKLNREKKLFKVDLYNVAQAESLIGNPAFSSGHQASNSEHHTQDFFTDSNLVLKGGEILMISNMKITARVAILGEDKADNLRGVSGSPLLDSKGDALGVVREVRPEENIAWRLVDAVPFAAIKDSIDNDLGTWL